MRRLCRALAALLIPAASLVVALIAVAGLVLTIGEDPGRALLALLRGAIGDLEGIGYTLFYATDYVFAGLAVALPFQAGLFNIGGEGQAALGGLGATLVVLALGDMPAPLVLAVAVVAAAGFGAAWAFVPASVAGAARQPSRHHYDHVQLHRHRAADLATCQGIDCPRPERAGDPDLSIAAVVADPGKHHRRDPL